MKEIIGNATLHLGDCRDILEKAEADLGMTDAPYKLTSGGNKKHPTSMKGGAFSEDNYDNGGEIVTCNIEWPEIMAVLFDNLKADADCYVMANDKEIFKAYNAAMAVGFQHHNQLAWDKITATPNRWYMKNVEFILYLWKGRAKTIADPSAKQLIRVPCNDETKHPTEKPVPLMEHYILNSSKPGDTVLDPFMGVGTTGVAALRTGRKFIGVEIERKWFDIACKRIAAAVDQPRLFGESA